MQFLVVNTVILYFNVYKPFTYDTNSSFTSLVSFFLRGKILSGILCLILQITILGWIPAAIWAVASRVDGKNEQRMRKLERIMRNYR